MEERHTKTNDCRNLRDSSNFKISIEQKFILIFCTI